MSGLLLFSRGMFLASGALWLIVGLLTPWASEAWLAKGKGGVFVTYETDKALYGEEPATLFETDPELVTFRRTVFPVIAGLLVAAGLMVLGVAWYGLAPPSRWALGLLTVVGLAVIPFWWIALGPYRAAGVHIPFLSLPPLMWLPGLLMPAAAILGWIGLTNP